MHRENILRYVAAIFLILLSFCGQAFGRIDDANIQRALKAYRNYHYSAALRYFKEAQKTWSDKETAIFTMSCVNTLEDMKKSFSEIERDELKLRRDHNNPIFASVVGNEHLRLAARLTAQNFYFIMVEPHLLRAAKLRPGDAQAYYDLGNLYYVAMQYPKAIKYYEEAIRLRPADFTAYKMAGDSAVALGDFDTAKKFYNNLLKVNKKANLLVDDDDVKKVKEVVKMLPETYREIEEMIKSGNDDEAETLLKKRLSFNKSDHIAITELGQIYDERGNKKEALKFYRNAIKIAPDYPIAHLLIGRLYYTMKKTKEAITELELFKEKMKLLPSMDKDTKQMYIDSLYYLGKVYYEAKKYADFKKAIDEIIALDEKEQDAYFELGIYYYLYEHSRPKAYEAFKKVIEIDPETPIARRAELAIDFIRANPDSRFAPDLSFPDRP
jgi:tetratricopeptide (TPR) repeat protein